MASWKWHNGKEFICPNCKKVFYRSLSRVQRTGEKYCSYACFVKMETGRECPARRRQIIKSCLMCGKSYLCVTTLVSKRKYCSKKCQYKSMRGYNLEKSLAWRGDKVKVSGLHTWLYKNYGSANKCENSDCHYPRLNSRNVMLEKPSRFEWANRDGQYLRKRENWFMLCPSCHRKYDYENKIWRPKEVII